MREQRMLGAMDYNEPACSFLPPGPGGWDEPELAFLPAHCPGQLKILKIGESRIDFLTRLSGGF